MTTLFQLNLHDDDDRSGPFTRVSRNVADDLDYVAISRDDNLITVQVADAPALIRALQAAVSMPRPALEQLARDVAEISCAVANVPEYTTAKVAPGLFQYGYPVLGVRAIYRDGDPAGPHAGRLIEVGYVAKTRGNDHVEWVVRNTVGKLWSSYGCTMRAAIEGAARDGII